MGNERWFLSRPSSLATQWFQSRESSSGLVSFFIVLRYESQSNSLLTVSMIKSLCFLIPQTKCGWGSSINFMAILNSIKVDSTILGGVFRFLVRLVRLSFISTAFPSVLLSFWLRHTNLVASHLLTTFHCLFQAPQEKGHTSWPDSQDGVCHPVPTHLADFNSMVFPTPHPSLHILTLLHFSVSQIFYDPQSHWPLHVWFLLYCSPSFPTPKPWPNFSGLTH